MDVNITINVGEDGDVKVDQSPIKRKKRKLKNGEETILEMPNTVESENTPNILNLMGM